MMSEIVLIDPPGSWRIEKKVMAPSLGLGYLASALEQADFKVKIVDMFAELMGVYELAGFIEMKRPYIVGITSNLRTCNNAILMAKTIKEIDPDIKIIMGGPHASFFPENLLNSGFVDVVCMFEGEITICELMRHYLEGAPSLESIKGIAYKRDDVPVVNPRREFIKDLDSIPFPARHLFSLDRYWGKGSLITARGCPFSCIFCSARAMNGGTCRLRSPDNVLEEMEEMHRRYKIEEFAIVDDTFTVSNDHAFGICDLLLERLDVTWSCDSRVDAVTEELIKRMYNSGCRTIHFGIESGNNNVLKKIRKNIDKNVAKKAVKLANRTGLQVICDFIIGHPFDTRETVADTLNFARELKSIEKNGGPEVIIHFSILAVAPGSYIYEHADELGVNVISPDMGHHASEEILVGTRHLTREDLKNFYLEGVKVSQGM
ncbi:MAG: radical SAM protein [Halobacteriota archaeon]|nr:radical SAM protein [Halobacteriota archaeon]